jgi:hypothetical protein
MEEIINGCQQSVAKKEANVYSPELKLALVQEFLALGPGAVRAHFARSKGIPDGTFDGWYWKYSGIERGHAREAGSRAVAPIDVTDALRPAARSPLGKTAVIKANGVAIELDADGMALLLEAIRRC